jgi:hypothetical protein
MFYLNVAVNYKASVSGRVIRIIKKWCHLLRMEVYYTQKLKVWV